MSRRLRKEIFLGVAASVVLILAVIRWIEPSVAEPKDDVNEAVEEQPAVVEEQEKKGVGEYKSKRNDAFKAQSYSIPRFKDAAGRVVKNRIYSVPGFSRTFPDLQDVQIVAAQKWGVTPVEDRKEAELRKHELVYVGSNPYYTMDDKMNYSIPYLVPRASDLLQKISRNFLDSLAVKGIPLHTLLVTSVLRTESDVRRLRRVNVNASPESCHRYGTTFDICYNRYNVVQNPEGPERRAVRSDSLKWVLSEVLRDVRMAGLCYIKYEVKQGCFHITVR